MPQEAVWVLKTLVLPPGGVVLLGLIGLMLGRHFIGKLLILLALSTVYTLSTPLAASRLMSGLETYPALTGQRLDTLRADGILILGGGRYSSAPEYGGADTVNGRLLERLRDGARLARRTGLPRFVSGGSADDEVPEARLSREVLEQEFKVRTAGIEERSRTTWENAYLSKTMLEARGISKVYLVTHAWHMPRAVEAFTRAGVEVVAAPTGFYYKGESTTEVGDWLPDPKALLASYYASHEYLGQLWYRLRHAL